MAGLGNVFTIRGLVELVTGGAEQSLDRLGRRAATTAGSFDRSFKQMGTHILKFQAITGAIRAVSGVLGAAVGSAMEFETGVRNLNTILKLSEKEFAANTERLRTLGTELGLNVSAAQSVAAAYDVAQAGFTKASDNALVMEASLKAAAAGGTKASTAANLIASTLKAYSLEADQASRVSDVYFKVVEEGIITFEQFRNGMGSLNAVAAQAGVPLEEIGAAVAVATNQGIKASTVFDNLKITLIKLLTPTEVQAAEMAKYGLVINENTIRQKGYLNTLNEIQAATGGDVQAMRKIIGTSEALGTVLAVVNNNGKNASDSLRNMYAASEGKGATGLALAEQAKAFAFQLDIAKNSVQSLGILIVSQFSGQATDAMKVLSGAVSDLDKVFKEMADGPGGLLQGLFDAFNETFPATGAALMELGETLSEIGDLFVEFYIAMGGSAETAAALGAVDLIGFALVKALDALANLSGLWLTFVGNVGGAARDLSTVLGSVWGTIEASWSKSWEGMQEVFQNFAYTIDQAFKAVIDKILFGVKLLPTVVQEELGYTKEVLDAFEKDSKGPIGIEKPKTGIITALNKIEPPTDENFRAGIKDARATNAAADAAKRPPPPSNNAFIRSIQEKQKYDDKERDRMRLADQNDAEKEKKKQEERDSKTLALKNAKNDALTQAEKISDPAARNKAIAKAKAMPEEFVETKDEGALAKLPKQVEAFDNFGKIGSGIKEFLTKKKVGSDLQGFFESTKPQAEAPAEATKEQKTADLTSRAKALEQEVELEKISKKEGLAKYTALVAEANRLGVKGKELFDIEKGLFSLRKDMTKEQEKSAEATGKLRVERLKLVKGELASGLEALELEKKARMKDGADSVELEAWYGAQRIDLFKKESERKAELGKKTVEIDDATADFKIKAMDPEKDQEKIALAGLDQEKIETLRGLKEQYDEIIKNKGDKLAAEKSYHAAVLAAEQGFNAERLKITKDAAKARAALELDAKNKILRNEAEATDDPEKAAAKNREADNAERLKQIREQVEAYRNGNVDQITIDKYLLSEQQKLRAEDRAARKAEKDAEKAEGEGGAGSAPTKTLSEAFATGFSVEAFSVDKGSRKRKRGDPAATAASNKLIGEIGTLGKEGAPKADDLGVHSTITVNVVADSKEIFSSKVSQEKGATAEGKTDYKLGRTSKY